MKPRVFVSSTYYDLKYVRENLERFIQSYYFEPVLFESGSVVFEHEEKLDISCYNEVKLCHMMILIIGGRYGSAASGQKDIDAYESQYVSITRNEYETALTKNIPIFIFVDKNVHSEYQTFVENKSTIEKLISKQPKEFKFAHVDNVNIFKFLDYLKNKPIKTFERFDEIEDYLRNQISGLFYIYLEQLQRKKEDERIFDTISELKNATQRMDELMSEVGKKIIGDEGYKIINKKQNELLIEFFIQTVDDNFDIETENWAEIPYDDVVKLSNIFFDLFINDTEMKRIYDISEYKKFSEYYDFKRNQLNVEMNNIFKLKISRLSYEQVNFRYLKKLKPIIDSDNSNELKSIIIDQLAKLFERKSGLPF